MLFPLEEKWASDLNYKFINLIKINYPMNIKRLLLFIFMLLSVACLKLSAQTVVVVNDLTELKNKIQTPGGDITITFSNAFVTGYAGSCIVNATMAHTNNIIIDGEVSGAPIVFTWVNGKHFTLNRTGSGGSLTMKNMTFKGNRTLTGPVASGTNGGGVTLSGKGTFKLYNTRFENINNRAVINSSVTEIVNSSFVNNYVGSEHGGAIYSDGTLTLSNCFFEKNSQMGGGYSGGAVAIFQASGPTSITNSVFKGNVSFVRGGGVSVYRSSQLLTVDNCYFEGNVVTGTIGTSDGGGISIYCPTLNTPFVLRNSTFKANVAGDDAGAVFVESTGPTSSSTITNCTFFGNIAKGNNNYAGEGSGGAVQISSTGTLFTGTGMIMTLNSNTFVKNIAEKGTGGAIGVYNVTMATVSYNLSNNIFLGNEIYNGTATALPNARYSNIGAPSVNVGGNIGMDYTAAETTALNDPVTGVNLPKVFGTESPKLITNFSNVYAGNPLDLAAATNYFIIPTISIIPNDGVEVKGMADGKAIISNAVLDERGYGRSSTTPDVGAVEVYWVRFNAGEGTWAGLNDSYEYDGEDYYKSTGTETQYYYKVTTLNGTVVEPTATLTHSSGKVFDKWVLDDGNDNIEWDPADALTSNVLVKALWSGGVFEVTYNPNGGGGTPTVVDCATDGSQTILNYTNPVLGFTPPTPYHVFLGWNTYPDGTGAQYNVNDLAIFTEDTELFALWKDNSPIPGIKIGDISPVCSDATEVQIPIELLYLQYPMNYTVYFSNEAKSVGFVDKTVYSAIPDRYITIKMPVGVPTGKYAGAVYIQCPLNPNVINRYPFEIEVVGSVAITRQPVSQTFGCEGGDFNLSVQATGSNLTYQWYHNDQIIPGATSSVYGNIISSTTVGAYHVEITGTCGTVVSDKAIITKSKVTEITRQPASVTAGCEGGSFSLSVEATGDNLTYQWYRNGQKIEGATSSHYDNVLSSEMTGSYTVIVTGSCGTVTSNTVTVSMSAATKIVSQPIAGFTGCDKDNFSLSVNAVGDKLSYQWYYNDRKIDGATSAKYDGIVSSGTVGYYHVVITGTCGYMVSNKSNVEMYAKTEIVYSPSSVRGCEGETFILSVVGSGRNLTYQWYYKDKKIEGATSSSYENTYSNNTIGDYYVEITGTCGNLVSNKANVSMNVLTILMKWDDVLYIENVGSKYVKFQWYKNGQAITQYGTAMYYTDQNGLLGTYFVRAYYADGTYDQTCPMTFTASLRLSSVAVYPNPVSRSEQLTVRIDELDTAKENAVITIYNLTGQKIYSTRVANVETVIPIDLIKGTYLVYITVSNGKEIVKKIIVK